MAYSSLRTRGGEGRRGRRSARQRGRRSVRRKGPRSGLSSGPNALLARPYHALATISVAAPSAAEEWLKRVNGGYDAGRRKNVHALRTTKRWTKRTTKERRSRCALAAGITRPLLRHQWFHRLLQSLEKKPIWTSRLNWRDLFSAVSGHLPADGAIACLQSSNCTAAWSVRGVANAMAAMASTPPTGLPSAMPFATVLPAPSTYDGMSSRSYSGPALH